MYRTFCCKELKKKGEDPKKSFFLFSSPKNSRASCWEEAVLDVFGGGAGPRQLRRKELAKVVEVLGLDGCEGEEDT